MSALAICLILTIAAVTSMGSVWLGLHMQILVGVSWCLLKQRMFTMMTTLAGVGYASLHTGESNASDITDDGHEDVQINRSFRVSRRSQENERVRLVSRDLSVIFVLIENINHT